MPIVEYTPEMWSALQQAVSRLYGIINLSHRPFVDYYYGTRPSCRLFLYIEDDGRILGTLGREVMPFLYGNQCITIRTASNWYSLQPGVGVKLTRGLLRVNPQMPGLMFGGSHDTLKILRRYGWPFIPGIKMHSVNTDAIAWPGEPKWKARARAVRRIFRRPVSIASRLPAEAASGLEVCEEHAYTGDLLPRSSPFTFRFAPDAEYLTWRYNLALSFVRYRVFRIVARGKSAGYVILNESPQKIIVAQCDGEDAASLAYGVLLSLAKLEGEQSGRAVYVTSSFPQMQAIFEAAGIKAEPGPGVPFAFRCEQWPLEMGMNPSSWLVNYDWGDNGLRSPFLDE